MALREVTNTKSRASGSKVTSNCALTSYQEDEDIQKIDAHLHFGDDLIFCCIGTPAHQANAARTAIRLIILSCYVTNSKILLANAILWSQTPLNAELSHLFNDTQAKFTDSYDLPSSEPRLRALHPDTTISSPPIPALRS
ncbi:uncharacterized protein C8R40DRAFT_1169683 [Lentinula edodes]|uniref:uncharacterized protein n=1 Tax=Lentinula edodes TaxID=5353 RepID=UPI001E8E6C6A|nr:uncharacterized protein C8R40DRAFT_1169683 [Lentinula edodes]KAH7876029.1 hypothetical protein C8R40DRAFT_1169683 [Lentinula edodes]